MIYVLTFTYFLTLVSKIYLFENYQKKKKIDAAAKKTTYF